MYLSRTFITHHRSIHSTKLISTQPSELLSPFHHHHHHHHPPPQKRRRKKKKNERRGARGSNIHMYTSTHRLHSVKGPAVMILVMLRRIKRSWSADHRDRVLNIHSIPLHKHCFKKKKLKKRPSPISSFSD